MISFAVVFGQSRFLAFNILADYISFLEIQRWQPTGSSLAVFAVFFIVSIPKEYIKKKSSMRIWNGF